MYVSWGLMDSLMENNASALESFDGQFPDDCPSKITDTADYACAAEEFCVKVTGTNALILTLEKASLVCPIQQRKPHVPP